MSDLSSLIPEGRRLIEEATKGRVLVNEYYHAVQTHEPGVPLAAVCYQGNTPAAEADLRRIVFAVNHLPLLLAVAEAAREARAAEMEPSSNIAPYPIGPRACHKYGCLSTKIGKKFGPCNCGGAAIQERIDASRIALDAALRGEVPHE